MGYARLDGKQLEKRTYQFRDAPTQLLSANRLLKLLRDCSENHSESAHKATPKAAQNQLGLHSES